MRYALGIMMSRTETTPDPEAQRRARQRAKANPAVIFDPGESCSLGRGASKFTTGSAGTPPNDFGQRFRSGVATMESLGAAIFRFGPNRRLAFTIVR